MDEGLNLRLDGVLRVSGPESGRGCDKRIANINALRRAVTPLVAPVPVT